MGMSAWISIFLAHTSEIDMRKFAIKHYRTMMHAHPLKNPRGKEYKTKGTLSLTPFFIHFGLS